MKRRVVGQGYRDRVGASQTVAPGPSKDPDLLLKERPAARTHSNRANENWSEGLARQGGPPGPTRTYTKALGCTRARSNSLGILPPHLTLPELSLGTSRLTWVRLHSLGPIWMQLGPLAHKSALYPHRMEWKREREKTYTLFLHAFHPMLKRPERQIWGLAVNRLNNVQTTS